MLTASQAKDVLNTIETAMGAALGADAWLKVGGTGGMMQIVARVLPTEQLSFSAAVLPALIAKADFVPSGMVGNTAGAYNERFVCSVEWIGRYGDISAGASASKTALARLVRWLREEHIDTAKRMNSLFDTGDGQVTGITPIEPAFERDEREGQFIVQTMIRFGLTMRVAGV